MARCGDAPLGTGGAGGVAIRSVPPVHMAICPECRSRQAESGLVDSVCAGHRLAVFPEPKFCRCTTGTPTPRRCGDQRRGRRTVPTSALSNWLQRTDDLTPVGGAGPRSTSISPPSNAAGARWRAPCPSGRPATTARNASAATCSGAGRPCCSSASRRSAPGRPTWRTLRRQLDRR